MSRPNIPSAKAIAHHLLAQNWQGHIELPVKDVQWIADNIHALLTRQQPSQCEGCGQVKLVVIRTRAGDFCDSCIEDIWDALEERRNA